MNTYTAKIAFIGLSLLSTVITGIMLTHSGKPYGTLIFTAHKLNAVGTVALIAWSVYQVSKAVDIRTLHPSMMAVTGVLFLVLFVSGALLSLVDGDLLSLGKPALQAIFKVHQVVPWLAVASSTISMVLIAGGGSSGGIGVGR